ncbi:hypothetical protein BVRB_7g162690 [Beta vulgaris subsp. vulgaris]|nr:hypothetical protein BVRB_7g162690 [Beta vulgaris subsp. vulgaris]
MSPDNLASTCVRKSSANNFKSSKEDQNGAENIRITPNNGNTTQATTTTVAVTNFDANGIMQKSPPKTHQDNIHHHHNQQQQASSSSAINQTNESSPSRNSACFGGGSSGGCVGGGGNDLLLQWGPRKRLRCSRTEGRSMVSVVLDKHHAATNPVMPPPHPPSSLPSTSSNGSRSGSSTRVKPHGLLYSKETPAFLPTKNRNLVDQMASNSASPSKNGGVSSRPVSRSTVGKRSPSCIEKNDKKTASSGPIRKVKSDDSLVPATVNGNHLNLVAQGEHEHGHSGSGHAAAMVRSPVADAEKGGEVVECPRIFISLSRKEKEDDFYAMKGTKLPHRPKKRAKAVDRALQYCFPGLWLSDLTRARYEVRERKSAKKPRRRGLKGLETMESDSE